MSRNIKANIIKDYVGFDTKREAIEYASKNKIYFNRRIKDSKKRQKDFINRLRESRNNQIVDKLVEDKIKKFVDDGAVGNIPTEVKMKYRDGRKVTFKLPKKAIVKMIEAIKPEKDEKIILEMKPIRNEDGTFKREFITVSPQQLRTIKGDNLLDDYYTTTILDRFDNRHIKIIRQNTSGFYSKHNGNFFKYALNDSIPQIKDIEAFMKRYQIYTCSKPNDDCCLIHSLKMSGVEQEKLNDLMLSTKTGIIPTKMIHEFADKYNYRVNVTVASEKSDTIFVYGDKQCKNVINLGLIDNHYFINEDSPITSYAIKKFDLVKDKMRWYQITNICNVQSNGSKSTQRTKVKYYSKKSGISSYFLIKLLMKSSLLKPLKLDEEALKLTNYKDLLVNGLTLTEEVKTIPISCKLTINEKIEKGRSILNKSLKKKNNSVSMLSKYIGTDKLNEIYCNMKHDRSEFFYNVFFDYEACTDQEMHREYMVSYVILSELDDSIVDESKIKTFIGNDCTELFLSEIVNVMYKNAEKLISKLCSGIKLNTYSNLEHRALVKQFINFFFKITLLAHNITYDIAFILPLVSRPSIFKRADKFVTGGDLYYKGIKFNVKDTMGIIADRLKSFSSMFGLKQEKEIMPYDIYTENNCFNNDRVLIDLAKSKLKESKRDLFISNLKRLNLIIDNDYFDHIGYAKYYCERDVKVMVDGYNTMKKWLKADFKVIPDRSITYTSEEMNLLEGIDMDNYLTISSIASDYLIKNRCFDDVVKIGGVARYFIQKSIVGGRCMTRNNKKYNIDVKINDVKINDLDAVSLYSTAMNLLTTLLGGILKGQPKLLTKNQLNMKFLNSVDGYFVKIKLLRIPKKYSFPIFSFEAEDGSRTFSNELYEDVYNDKCEFVKRVDKSETIVSKIALEDLMNFCEVTEEDFEIIEGYYFNEGRNPLLGLVIQEMFNQRLSKKKLGLLVQVLYKLLMNAAYGFTTLKEQDKEHKFIDGEEEMKRFIVNNFHRQPMATEIIGAEKRKISMMKYVKNKDIENASKRFEITMDKEISDHFNSCHVGSEILAMSKRIMNKVMCLAEDNGIKIYYQDTDSMHIENDQIDDLAKLFKQKYGHDMIGKNMGQFHCDFEPPEKMKPCTVLYSDKFIALGKKSYLDRVVVKKPNGETDFFYHSRMKGIPKKILKKNVKDNYGGNYEKLYTHLFNNGYCTFDLNALMPKIKMYKDGTTRNIKEFTRTVAFIDYKHRDEYFDVEEIKKALKSLKDFKSK